MRYTLTALTLAGALLASPAAFAQTAKPAKPAAAKPATAAKPAAATVHSVEGVVKSVDASTVVITRSGKKGGEMSFKVDSATQKDGTIETGSKVSIRYHMDGAAMVANAVRVEAAKAPKTAKK